MKMHASARTSARQHVPSVPIRARTLMFPSTNPPDISAIMTALYHDGRFMMWYSGLVDCGKSAGDCQSTAYRYPASMAHQEPTKRGATFYAESVDGIRWSTPPLGILPWGANGSTANNLVIDSGTADYNRGVFLDEREPNASRRFKAFGSFFANDVGTMLSADGLHWHSHMSAAEMGVRAAA